jgi:hypothetical protein
MNFELFKFSLLTKLIEFKKEIEQEKFDSKNFDSWFERFIEFLGYDVKEEEIN